MINLTPNQAQSKMFQRAKKSWKQKAKPWLLGIGIPLGVIIIILGIFAVKYLSPMRSLVAHAKNGKNSFTTAQQAVTDERFREAGDTLVTAQKELALAQQEIEKMGGLRSIPYVKTQLSAVDNILKAGTQTASALSKIAYLADEIITPVKTDAEFSLAKLKPEQKHVILQKISEAYPDLVGVKAEIDLAVLSMEQIPDHGIYPTIKKMIQPIKDQLPTIKKSIAQALPAAELLPPIAGYPNGKTYLFLLENNTELRPAGGFIGTYGILKIKDAEISYFKTDNIYNLDNPFQNTLIATPPEPLQKYLAAEKWFMRDSNWSPDFPTSAQKALWFYQQENGPEKNIDGVVAVTPNFIESLIRLTGDITVNGVKFTPDNFVETMQYQVEQGFYRQGISDAERKEIIGVMSQQLMDRLLNFPQSRWGELWQVIMNHIEEKQLMFYSKDESLQTVIARENWGGAVSQEENTDYVMFVDANMAALKTDRIVDRAVTYAVEQTNDGLIGDLTITYSNKGSIDWKTTRYRSYTRVYVPKGSTLIESSGPMTNDKLHNGKPTDPDITEELGKTVFGGFISIEPGEEGTLHYRYRLPDSIISQSEENKYTLNFQKQPGTKSYPLSLSFAFKRNIFTAEPIDKIKKTDDTHLTLSTDLQRDRSVEVTFR
ncbi:MAG: DUF4012 domain-containing protein [Patescibacteria group bacterium]